MQFVQINTPTKVLVRSNATTLLLARGTPLSSLIPVSAHVALCVHVDVLTDRCGCACKWSADQ